MVESSRRRASATRNGERAAEHRGRVHPAADDPTARVPDRDPSRCDATGDGAEEEGRHEGRGCEDRTERSASTKPGRDAQEREA
jgi:hypothetical protein